MVEFKETRNIPSSIEFNSATPTERNYSNNREIYDVLFPTGEKDADTHLDNTFSHDSYEKQRFGNVSTLDWLKTWRPVEIS